MLRPDKLKSDEKMLSQFVVTCFRTVGEGLALVLSKTPVTPNQVSAFGLFLIFTASYLLTKGEYAFNIAAAVVLYLVVIIDFTDGSLSRRKGMATKFGDWFDAMVDEIREFVVIFCLALGIYRATGDYSVWIAAYFVFGSDAFIMRVVGKFYKTENKQSHFDEVNKKAKGNPIFNIVKQFVSVRILKYAVFPFFAIFNASSLYLKFFALYGFIIALGFLFYYSLAVWRKNN